MAQPPLDHQLEHVAQIVLARRTGASFSVDAMLKGAAPAAPFTPDIKVFELLGIPWAGGQAVLLITATGQILDLMPVTEGRIIYAPNDASVRRDLTLDELRRAIP